MCTLRAVNRRVIEAIETPPDTGAEQRLDKLAADLRERADGEGSRLDPGHLCRLRHALRRIAESSPEGRARHLMRAREMLGNYAEESGGPRA